MGYIQLFGEKLEALLVARGIGEADREEIIAYVKHAVLESYRNGQEAGRRRNGKKPADRQRRPAYDA